MALLCATMLVFAQNSTQTALLQHGDETTTFYGADAFINAHAAATAGDIITLSSGTFNTPRELTKPITLRGVGCVTDDELNIHSTTIAGDIIVSCGGDANQHLTVEGIFFNGTFKTNGFEFPVFIRCNFHTIDRFQSEYGGRMTDAEFINCRIKSFRLSTNMNNLTFRNCAVFGMGDVWENETASAISAYNSFLWLDDAHRQLSAYNSLISGSGPTGNSVAYNCIGWGGVLNGCETHGCWVFMSNGEVFETFNYGVYDWTTEPLLLKAEIQNQCVGPDGTQVGIYGGNMPYATRPTYMTPYRTTVGQHSTPDGKLNIHIEVIDGNK